MSKAIAGHRYRHYKKLWVRDRKDFESKVLLPDGSTVDRFTEI